MACSGEGLTMHPDGRRFLRSPINAPADLVESDQERGMPAPAGQKPAPAEGVRIELIAPAALGIGKAPLLDLLRGRASRRTYTEDALTLQELSFLLWAVQGVHSTRGDGLVTRRTVPASGGIHPFETYLAVNRVQGVPSGLYRYLPLEHTLLFLHPTGPEWLERLTHACRGQAFVSRGAVAFLWTAIPYRTEWRYANEAHKAIAQASGHMCQNLYLACEAIGAGTCAVSAYAQGAMDALLGVDAEEEFTVYLAPVGKVAA
jgi:SagB-type dehydrogenase family enzyme